MAPLPELVAPTATQSFVEAHETPTKPPIFGALSAKARHNRGVGPLADKFYVLAKYLFLPIAWFMQRPRIERYFMRRMWGPDAIKLIESARERWRAGQRSPPGRPRARRHPVREGRPRRARGGERGMTGLGTSTVRQPGALLPATRETQLSLDS